MLAVIGQILHPGQDFRSENSLAFVCRSQWEIVEIGFQIIKPSLERDLLLTDIILIYRLTINWHCFQIPIKQSLSKCFDVFAGLTISA